MTVSQGRLCATVGLSAGDWLRGGSHWFPAVAEGSKQTDYPIVTREAIYDE
jgi:hypothetical protein